VFPPQADFLDQNLQDMWWSLAPLHLGRVINELSGCCNFQSARRSLSALHTTKTGGSFSSMAWVFVLDKTSYVARRMRGCCIYGNGLWWQI
jgi:hypothetical protein